MSRRWRVRRWLAGWRRLIEFGKMLQALHEDGLTVGAFATEGAPLMVKHEVARAKAHEYPMGTVTPIGGKL